MTNSPAQNSDAILAAARNSLTLQRAGGRRLAPIGDHSRALRRTDFAKRLKLAAIGTSAVLLGTGIIGLIINGIGFTGMMLTALGVAAAVILPLRYPRMKLPSRDDLPSAPLGKIVGQVELWLENQRPALPAPSIRLIDHIGTQLDTLNLQLATLDDQTPAAGEVRRLVGDHLPELISAYTAIPAPLRTQQRSGTTPDDQLAASLTKISGEIDSLTHQLADGALDRLAIQSRYLETKYTTD
jgi:hypothetical protein